MMSSDKRCSAIVYSVMSAGQLVKHLIALGNDPLANRRPKRQGAFGLAHKQTATYKTTKISFEEGD